MTDQTRLRFLAAIARQIPPERVEEIHLFPAIRQGGMESGVAVIAIVRDVEVLEPEGELIAAPAVVAAPSRFTVYSAGYRLTLKGLDRGKWEISVTEEADAPLVTVDAVVRGVQRRSGESDEILRLSGDDFRASIAAPTV